MNTKPTSDINLQLPAVPLTTDPKLYQELLTIYSALQILQQELSKAKQRIAILEAP